MTVAMEAVKSKEEVEYQEWEALMIEAMKIGLTIEEVRKFINEKSAGA